MTSTAWPTTRQKMSPRSTSTHRSTMLHNVHAGTTATKHAVGIRGRQTMEHLAHAAGVKAAKVEGESVPIREVAVEDSLGQVPE
jgi:hypothetical protein